MIRLLGSAIAASASLLLACPGAHAAAKPEPARTWWVAPSGSDVANGSERHPFATVGHAADVARSGETVMVASGRYRETVGLTFESTGVRFVGYGRRRPIIDGQGSREYGFVSNNPLLHHLRVRNFEVRGQTVAGLSLVGSRLLVKHNWIHDIGRNGGEQVFGVQIVNGSFNRVVDNLIESVGPGGEAMGVKLTTTTRATVARNEIRLIRKEGVRDYVGLDNVIRDNQISLCWTGIAFSSSVGALASNNYVHDNVQGFNPKHTSEPSALKQWGLSEPHWSRIYDNTVFRSSSASVAIAISAPAADYIDIRNNVFSGAGDTYLADAPAVRGPHMIVDGNVYSPRGGRPTWLYHTGYDFKDDGLNDLLSITARLGWEEHGRLIDAPPDPGQPTPPASAFPVRRARGLGADLGPLAGATKLPPESDVWHPVPMTPIASTSEGTAATTNHLDDSADGVHHTYWSTSTAGPELVIYDFGGQRTFQQIMLDVYTHGDKHNVRGYRFELSRDGERYQTLLAGENPDAEGSAYTYELRRPVTGRYLKVTLVDTFCDSYEPRLGCGDYLILGDLRLGQLLPGQTIDALPASR